MVVTSVPWRLRFAVGSLLLCIFWIVLEVMIVSRTGWRNLPYAKMGYWALAFFLISFPLAIWLMNANRWAYYLVVGLSSFWVAASGWMAYRMRYPPLGFLTLSLCVYLIGVLAWLRQELSRSFFSPRLRWYEGLPKAIPGLRCFLESDSQRAEFRVSRIDREGAFVFVSSRAREGLAVDLTQLLMNRSVTLNFSYRDYKLCCEGAPTLLIERNVGAGIRFWNLSPDLQKEIGDFIELLRGEGYD